MYRTKRVYEPVAPDDGFRVLVDRLWPRGVSKDRAALGLWLKDVAPSTELRQWFHRTPDAYDEFAERYRAELADNPALDELRRIGREHDPVTLLYSAADPDRNHARIIAELLAAG
jgi:uncharacterized protein YeaO (DUF488 family)